jgi:hypothetical protein
MLGSQTGSPVQIGRPDLLRNEMTSGEERWVRRVWEWAREPSLDSGISAYILKHSCRG